MSRASFVVATAAAVAILPSSILAQSAAPRMSALSPASAMLVVRPESSAYRVTMPPIAPMAAAAQESADDDRPSLASKIVRSVVGVGVGAAVGGWLGYFGAQVAHGDWERIADSEKTSLRQSYTKVGLGVGAIAGYFLRPKPHANRLPQPFNIPARTGRLLLAHAELRRSIATNALEAIEMGRPEWIQQQRKDEAAHGSAPANAPVESTSLVVYVGDEKVGAIETLRDIAIPEITELRFYDSRDARRRWGGNHKYGAIEVVPADASVTVGESAPAGE
ncbi:MAG TPA: hypothetical protein VF461_16875 [Gemmatimonadaceae bacterium]